MRDNKLGAEVEILERKISDHELVLRIAGEIGESADLASALSGAPGRLIVYCAEITRMNSTGVKTWTLFFQDQLSRGTEVILRECSAPVVDQMNMMGRPKALKVESLLLPYVCDACGQQDMILATPEEMAKKNFEPEKRPCPKCGARMEFDDLPREYFAFLLTRSGTPGPG